MTQQLLFPLSRSARFSTCGHYRYTLWRSWGDGPFLNVIALNPSTADRDRNDPTCERLERRARSWDFGSLIVTNIFAWRSTNPKVLRQVADPIGPENDRWIMEWARRSDMVLCAWGAHGSLHHRGEKVRKMLTDAGLNLHCLIGLDSGEPGHALYLPYSLKPAAYCSGSE